MSKIVVFLDDKCGPSQQLKKVLKNIGNEIAVEVVKIAGDPARVLAEGIRAVPTIQVLDKNDHVIKTLVGYNVNVLDKIKEALSG